jgi:hypothetical protein
MRGHEAEMVAKTRDEDIPWRAKRAPRSTPLGQDIHYYGRE